MPATQEDVARLAGVSRKTVSNVVNGFPHISKDVATRVGAAILELGYTPNHAARSLRTGRTGTIQLVVPELEVSYFAELAQWVVAAAEERGLSVLIRQTRGDRERERLALEGASGEATDGTILSPVSSDLAAIVSRKSQAPVVLVGEVAGGGMLPHIGIDNEAAAYAATQHLIRSGRRRVGFIGAQRGQMSHMARMRRDGYERALRDADLVVDERLVRYTDGYHRREGAAALRDLAATDLDGAFCATDLLALGAIRAARDLGIDVPVDLAVVGIDGLDEGEYSVPRLSTVAPDKNRIATRAVERLLEAIDTQAEGGTPRDGSEEVVGFELVQRESSS
ncbi:LacI family DNA-binding transcriptional regulator [Microbacterium insulae]|uniref:LacI family DNA-binding transcriptional regulator n=1 Tax=Microbacterium insulae TaxID=483014 RepID=A0ABW3AHL3_9MICO